MKEYDLYLFDFDNTLYDTRFGIQEILRHALPMVGVEYRDDMFPQFSGLSMEQVFDRFVGDPEKYETYRDEFMRIVNTDVYRNAKPFPEVPEVLRTLKGRGKHIGIASGKTGYKIVNLLNDYDLGDIPEVIVGYEDTELHKPHPDPILLAMSHFDIEPDRVLYVGDSSNDSDGARNAGIDCAIVNRHNGLTPDGLECTYELDDTRELLDYRADPYHLLS